jgi:hypothetical protein
MALERSYDSESSYLPPNTVVVLPKPLPMNRGALWVLFWTIGLLMGLFARAIIDGPGDTGLTNVPSGNAAGAVAAAAEAPTMQVNVHAVLELPSPTATDTPGPTATSSPDPAASLNFCTNAEPGKLCKVPFPSPPTPTPYPSCTDMDRLTPGDWCIWPTEAPSLASHE